MVRRLVTITRLKASLRLFVSDLGKAAHCCGESQLRDGPAEALKRLELFCNVLVHGHGPALTQAIQVVNLASLQIILEYYDCVRVNNRRLRRLSGSGRGPDSNRDRNGTEPN